MPLVLSLSLNYLLEVTYPVAHLQTPVIPLLELLLLRLLQLVLLMIRKAHRFGDQNASMEDMLPLEVTPMVVRLQERMSLMGELTFFLGLQVKQKKDDIFISQDKYVADILRKFGLSEGKSASTPIDVEKPFLKDSNDEDIDVHTYRSMIGSLMYLTSSRPDIMFAVCACVRFQVTLKVSHLNAVKRIFKYLKGKPYLGL
uniref:Reverse transcriptase Ty1/copia-type domain-containing protein n=1 Tax=Tanacetum cinerariifolium TaxID=118510 RepID=A0A699LF32_TANCI|nr:hypothetical protein [Tanacetum cinerariifolium]